MAMTVLHRGDGWCPEPEITLYQGDNWTYDEVEEDFEDQNDDMILGIYEGVLTLNDAIERYKDDNDV